MKIEGFPIANPGEKQIGIRSCYHLHFDPDLGANKAAVRRIPCSCEKCSKQKNFLGNQELMLLNNPDSQGTLNVNMHPFLVHIMTG